MRLMQGVYCYPWESSSENNANSYVFDGTVPTLIDPGHARHREGLFARMREDGFHAGRVALVICTHLHPDHFEGAAFFSQRGVPVAHHREGARYLKEYGYGMYEAMGLPVPNVPARFYLTEGSLWLANTEVTVYHTPGHSPDSICLHWKELGALVTGDVIFYRSVGRTDFHEGNGHALESSVSKLATIEADYVLPGHGPIVAGKSEVRENFVWVQHNMFAVM